jgi:photosystem II stability/assembly factor-like uncharacterized protein
MNHIKSKRFFACYEWSLVTMSLRGDVALLNGIMLVKDRAYAICSISFFKKGAALKGIKAIRIVIVLGILVLSLGAPGFIANSPQARAGALTGWYEQESGVTEDLRGVSAMNANIAWAVGTHGIILKTTDGGVTWTPQTSGITTGYLTSVSAVDADTAWAVGTSGTILNTVDGGATWTPQTSGTTKTLWGVSAVNSSIAWAVGGGYIGLVRHSIIFKTTDGGVIWNPQASDFERDLTGISAADTNSAWAVGADGILKTIDGGTTWGPQSKPAGSTDAISAFNASTAWIAGSPTSIVGTTDGGATWEQQNLGGSSPLNGISAADANNAWAVGGTPGDTYSYRIILKTSDGGTTWEYQANEILPGLFGVSAANADTAWAVGSDGLILHTTGGGAEYSRYFAEGYTGPGFQEYLCLGNPQSEQAQVNITYIFPDGNTQEQKLSIAANSRSTVNVNSEVGEGREVSVKVISDKDISIERPMYFTYNGAWSGGHDSQGAVSPECVWYFAEGYTGPGFEEWVCILNPGDTQANLAFHFQTQEEGVKEVKDLAVPPHSRSTFKVNDILGPNYQNCLRLDADQQVVAERSIYFDYLGMGDHHWQGGHCVTGFPGLLTEEYYFPEGTTRSGFEEWLTIQNPWTDGKITVNAIYQFGPGQGDPVVKDYEIESGFRHTLYVPAEVGEGRDVSVKLSCGQIFLAERPMYFSYDYGVQAQGGDCTIGALSPSSEWFFAEGYTGPGFQEWLCLQNPGDEESSVELTYLTQEAGALPPKTVTIPPKSRLTLMVNEQAGENYQLSTKVKVLSGPGIIAERPMYFDSNGWNGGHVVVGYTP